MAIPDRNAHERQGDHIEKPVEDPDRAGPKAMPPRRGFAGMDEDKQREIASKGGHSVPAEQRSFAKDHTLAAEAGRKGGQSVPRAARSFSKNRALASAAGHKGAMSRNAARTHEH